MHLPQELYESIFTYKYLNSKHLMAPEICARDLRIELACLFYGGINAISTREHFSRIHTWFGD
jgi:hypothetical protein